MWVLQVLAVLCFTYSGKIIGWLFIGTLYIILNVLENSLENVFDRVVFRARFVEQFPKKIQNKLFYHEIFQNRSIFKIQSNIEDGHFCENS